MSVIKQIFLDLDGPLLDGKARHYSCYRSILEKFGFEPIGIDAYWETKRALVNRMDLLKMSGAQAIYDDFLGAWLLLIESPEMLALDKVQESAVECLHNWKAQGVELTLVTMRKNWQALEAQLNVTGLRPYLDAVLVCNYEEGGIGKADAVRNHFQGKVNIGDALWIGDTEADWQAARTLGCAVVLLANGLRNETYLRSLQGAVVMPTIKSLQDSELGRINVS